MKRLIQQIVICFILLALALEFGGPNKAHSLSITWKDIAASPTEGLILVDGKQGKIPTIQKITPSDLKGATISVDTSLSAVNTDNDLTKDEKLAAIALDPALNIAQAVLSGLDPTKTVLDGVVSLTGALVKNHPTASITASSFSATVDSDILINDIDLMFAGLVVAQKGALEISSGQIGALATFNGVNVPIEFSVLNTNLKGNPLTIDGISSTLGIQLFRGTGHADISPANRGILSISPLALLATERGTPADSFSAIALTNWTATVSLVPEPTTILLLGFGLIGLAGLSKRKFTKR